MRVGGKIVKVVRKGEVAGYISSCLFANGDGEKADISSGYLGSSPSRKGTIKGSVVTRDYLHADKVILASIALVAVTLP